jgi:hypothetical protein
VGKVGTGSGDNTPAITERDVIQEIDRDYSSGGRFFGQ